MGHFFGKPAWVWFLLSFGGGGGFGTPRSSEVNRTGGGWEVGGKAPKRSNVFSPSSRPKKIGFFLSGRGGRKPHNSTNSSVFKEDATLMNCNVFFTVSALNLLVLCNLGWNNMAKGSWIWTPLSCPRMGIMWWKSQIKILHKNAKKKRPWGIYGDIWMYMIHGL